jgi:predicted transcriptional regulator
MRELEIKNEQRKRIGEQFRRVREEQGWSVWQVAMMADVKDATVEKIEAGAFNVPLDILTRVADVLDCEMTIMQREV